MPLKYVLRPEVLTCSIIFMYILKETKRCQNKFLVELVTFGNCVFSLFNYIERNNSLITP